MGLLFPHHGENNRISEHIFLNSSIPQAVSLESMKLANVSFKSLTILGVPNPVSTGPGTVVPEKAAEPKRSKKVGKFPVVVGLGEDGIRFSKMIKAAKSWMSKLL